MRKNFLNQEKGIALSMAIIIMFALFLITTAYFISTQNECFNISLNKAKVKAIEVASVGAERAMWDIQQRLENDPNWQPDGDEIQLLYTDYNYFGDLGQPGRRDPYNYAKECVQVGATEPSGDPKITSVGGVGSQVYAVKMRKEDNPSTPEIEWAIYALGIERTTGLLSQMNMQAVKVVVQLGQIGQVDFQTMYDGEHDPREDTYWYPNTSLQIDGRDNTAKVFAGNKINDEKEGHNPGGESPADYAKSTTDGYEKSQFILSYLSEDNLPENAIYDSQHITKNKVTTPLPFPNIDFSKTLADYPPDYNAEDLLTPLEGEKVPRWILVPEVHNGITYYHYEFNTIGRGVAFVNSMKDNPLTSKQDSMQDEINRLCTTYGVDYKDSFYNTTIYEDVNQDGFIVIKIPENGYNLRVGSYIRTPVNVADIVIFPNTHVIILAEGKGSNEYTLTGGDNKLNTNVSIEFRSSIVTAPFRFVDTADVCPTEVNYKVDANGDPKIGPDTTTVSRRGEDKVVPVVQPDDPMLGTLDILAKNDVIFGQYWGGANQFRGMVYSSNGKVEIAKDMFLQGSICAKKGVYWEDEGAMKGQEYEHRGDGIDTAIWHENPLQRTNNEMGRNPSLSARWVSGGGVGTGAMRIISWENIGKVKDTFGN